MADEKYNQFTVNREYFLQKVDFLNWYRYYFILKDVLENKLESILEIGTGSGLLKNCISPLVNRYHVMDVNPNLEPDIHGDVRVPRVDLERTYDCVIAADILEHVPYSDIASVCQNIRSYLLDEGMALITIPHRRSNFLFMSPTQIPHVFTVPTGFLSPGSFYRRFIKRKIWIDPDHCWEIGDGKIKREDVEKVFVESGFEIVKIDKLLYVDYFVLRKM